MASPMSFIFSDSNESLFLVLDILRSLSPKGETVSKRHITIPIGLYKLTIVSQVLHAAPMYEQMARSEASIEPG